MRRGTFSTCKAPFGFRLVDGKLVIEESEAEIIRLIFRRYLDGNSHASIAEEVSTFGIPTRDGHDRWQRRTIRYILENERYAGDSMLQKRFTTDALPYRQKWNHGEKTMYFVPESNPPIISKETFEKAQSLLKWKAKDVMTRCETPHNFTLAIVCDECGSFFKRKVTHGRHR